MRIRDLHKIMKYSLSCKSTTNIGREMITLMRRKATRLNSDFMKKSLFQFEIHWRISRVGFLGKEHFWFVLAALFFSLAVRWPFTAHEVGIDSFNIHAYAETITRLNSIEWSASILSYFGLFPFSYASGVPILLSEASIMTGTSIEIIILVFSMITALIGTLAAFILSLEIKDSALLAFAVAIGYSVSPIFLEWTQWTVTTRSLFMALLPLIIWILLRYSRVSKSADPRSEKIRLLLLFSMCIVLLALIHRMFVVIILLVMAYLIARSAINLINLSKTSLVIGTQKLKSFLFNIIIIISIICLTIYLAILGGWLGIEAYEEGFFEGSSDVIKILNLAASSVAAIGLPLAMLMPFSIIFAITGRRELFGIFLISAFLLLLLFSGGRTYERIIYPIVAIPLIIHSSRLINRKESRRKFIAIMILILLATVPANLLIVDYYNHWPEKKVINDGNAISDQTYATAMYMREYFGGYHYVCNNWIASIRIQAFSGVPELPCGSFSMASNILIYHIINKTDLGLESISIDEIILNKGIPFESDWENRIISDWGRLFIYKNTETQSEILSKYNTRLFIEDSRLNMKVVGYQSTILYPLDDSPAYFIDDGSIEKTSVHDNCFKIYDNGREIIWLLNR